MIHHSEKFYIHADDREVAAKVVGIEIKSADPILILNPSEEYSLIGTVAFAELPPWPFKSQPCYRFEIAMNFTDLSVASSEWAIARDYCFSLSRAPRKITDRYRPLVEGKFVERFRVSYDELGGQDQRENDNV